MKYSFETNILSNHPLDPKNIVVLTDLDRNLEDDGEDIIQGLTQPQKKLPSKYFYDDRGSALFEQICELPEYYPTRTEAAILDRYANEIARFTGCCELIELGSGSSTKTRLLLAAYQKLSGAHRYLPIDVSGGILKTSVQQLSQEYPTFTIEGLIGTYDRALAHLASTPTLLPRMVFFLGSSMGNFTPRAADEFWEKIATTLNPGDYFLLGIDLQKSPEILTAAYNDRQGVTAAFNLNILNHLNWRFQGDFCRSKLN
jgi:L-histidine Nalpha-methyltransferase